MACKLPARFVDDRIFLHPRTVGGEELCFCTDTGGGSIFIRPETVRRLGLTPQKRVLDAGEFTFVDPPAFGDETPLPMGVGMDVFLVRGDLDWGGADGCLGQSWFADRVWRFDYPRHELTLLGHEDTSDGLHEHACPLGFQTLPDGRRTTNFPRISAEIDGDRLEFLFDTGAHAVLTPQGLEAFAGECGPRPATSFVTRSVFERWRGRHPDWRVIEHADATADEAMILVPLVRLAGHEVGPVWFTRRGDSTFHEWMSQWMDKRIDGALGGSLFRYFRVTVDYPNAVAYFQKALQAGAAVVRAVDGKRPRPSGRDGEGPPREGDTAPGSLLKLDGAPSPRR